MTTRNFRIKNLYNHKCNLHYHNCLIIDNVNQLDLNKKIKNLHILDASNINEKENLDSLPQSIEFLEIFNLNYDLTNLPIGLKNLYIVSYKKFNIKIPFGCNFTERIMNYNDSIWTNQIEHHLIKSMTLEIGGIIRDHHGISYSHFLDIWKDLTGEKDDDRNSHTGKNLDSRTKLIYELANYL